MSLEKGAPPPVLKWYKIYCAVMVLVYLLCLAGSVFGAFYFRHEITRPVIQEDWLMVVYLVMLLGISGVLAIAYGASFFIRPRPWAWVYHLVLIAIGLTSPCFLPASIPLLIFWIRPETRRYFGRV